MKEGVSTTSSGQLDVTLQNASTHSLRTCSSELLALKSSTHHHIVIAPSSHHGHM